MLSDQLLLAVHFITRLFIYLQLYNASRSLHAVLALLIFPILNSRNINLIVILLAGQIRISKSYSLIASSGSSDELSRDFVVNTG